MAEKLDNSGADCMLFSDHSFQSPASLGEIGCLLEGCFALSHSVFFDTTTGSHQMLNPIHTNGKNEVELNIQHL